MKQQRSTKSLHVLFSATLIAMLTLSMIPAQTARAQEMTLTSDLVLTLVSIPKHVKACDIFEAAFTVTNLGPDPASNIQYNINIPDPYQDIAVWRAPTSLAVGEEASFWVVIWVGGFVEGELRAAHVEVTVTSSSIDPNLDNNVVRATNTIIGKHQGCSFP